MTQRATSLHIPQPCAESWATMTPVSGGRHCASCQKTVMDFTQKTDAEIMAYLRQVGVSQACGRLRAGQLGLPLQTAAPASCWRTWLRALVTASGLVSAATSRAATQVVTTQHAVAPSAGDTLVSKATDLLPDILRIPPTDTLIELRGVVLDAERCEPLPGVTVAVQNSTLGTATNAKGEFSLKLKPTAQSTQLLFSFVGFVSRAQTVALQDSPTRQLEVALDTAVMGELFISQSPPWPWHPRAFYQWGKYWLTRPFRR